MAQKTPLPPAEILARMLRVAGRDGRILLVVGALFALLAASARSVGEATVGLVAAGAGAMVLHGASLLRNGYIAGYRWLPRAHLILFAAVCFLVSFILAFLSVEVIQTLPEENRRQFEQLGISETTIVRMIQSIYVGFGILSLIYQGSMILYYRRRRVAVEQALSEPGPTE